MILYAQWLGLPIATRIKIAQAFNIPRTRPTHVSGNELIEDGYAIKDVENALTTESIQNYVDSKETNHATLWNQLIDSIEGRTPITPEIVKVKGKKHVARA